ncbi:MAG: amidohydrolase family protein, partial [Shinella sp.]
MSTEFVLINVRPNGAAAKDVVIRDGRIAEILPYGSRPFAAEIRVVDGEGLLMLPGLVDAHTHLDKTLLGMPWYRNDVGLELIDLIENERRMKRELGIDPARQSAAQIERSVANGTSHIRTHVDIDTEYGLAGLEGVLASRYRYRDIVDIEIVAFPQSGMLIRPGTVDLMEQATRAGADVVGGLDPSGVDRDPKGHLDTIFAMAERHGKPVDIHLH